jgi:hypothetical protein
MKYACLVYIEDKKQDNLSEAELAAIVAECYAAAAWAAELKASGHHVFSAGLQSMSTAITVRRRNGKVFMSDGPFAETKEFLGGFTIIEARDMNEAIQLVSKFQTRMLTIEIRPVKEPNADFSDPSIARSPRRSGEVIPSHPIFFVDFRCRRTTTL